MFLIGTKLQNLKFKLYLKEEHEGGVEGGESREETHCGAPEGGFVHI